MIFHLLRVMVLGCVEFGCYQPGMVMALCRDQDPKTKELFKGKLGIRNQSVLPREISKKPHL